MLRLTTALAALAALAIAAPAFSANEGVVKVGAELKGKNAEPGPGDPDGEGRITLFLKASKQRACFELRLEALDAVTAARIHQGSADDQGPAKLVLFKDRAGLDGDGSYDGCIKKVKKGLLRSIARSPGSYYVNLYTNSYPQGAARGQLKPRG